MNLRNIIEEIREARQQEKRKIELFLRDAPIGTLVYSKTTTKGKAYYKWYVAVRDQDGNRKRIYIPRKNRKLAHLLARKRLLKKRLADINAQLSATDAFLAKYREYSDIDALLDAPLLENLLAEEQKPSDDLAEELRKWAEEDYEQNPKHPEHKIVPTVDKIMVRSKSEAFIVMLLSTLHIPYRYECKLEIGGYDIYPDFTIRHPLTGKVYYWEHVGRLDKEDYRQDFLFKMRLYVNNGVLPDHNLILTYESDGHPFDITIAQDKIREFFSCEVADLY